MMNTGLDISHRLIRTETMHYLNESAKRAYKDGGCKEVQLWAAVDERTCPVCGVKHGNKYSLKDAPILPLHANCRCTYIPVIDREYTKKDHDEAKEDINNEWREREKRKVKSSTKGNDDNYSYKESNIDWSKQLGISKSNSGLLNEIHTELNKFMIDNRREKIFILNLEENKVIDSLEGSKND